MDQALWSGCARGWAPWLEQAGGGAERLGQTWEVAAWENAFGKVPNTEKTTAIQFSLLFPLDRVQKLFYLPAETS